MGQLQLRDELEKSTREAVEALMDLWAAIGGYPRRHYGPGPHPGTGTPQTVHGDIGTGILSSGRAEEFGGVLYHGTTRRHLPAISQYGLEPRIGPMVEWAYGEYAGEEYNDPQTGESMVPTYTYFTGPQTQEMQFSNETAMAKAFGYVRQAVSFEMYGDLHHDVTWDDVEKHGLLVAVDEEELEGLGFHMRGNDDIFYDVYYDWDDANEKMIIHHDEARMGAYTGPEPGDYFTENITTPSKVIYGKELVRLGKYLENKLMTLGPEAQMLLPLEYRNYLARHYGPGPHPGTGTSQDVHGSGGARASVAMQNLDSPAILDEEREQKLRQWRFDHQDIMDATIEVLERSNNAVEVEYPESLKKYLSGTGLDARFLISHDGRIWSVGDHDIVAEEVQSRFMTGDRLGNTATDVNPDKEEMRAFDKLHGWHQDNYNPKNELIVMGFVRGSIIDESRSPNVGITMQFTTPLEPAVRRTVKDFLDVYEGQNFLFDINFGEEAFVTQDERQAKAFIMRFLEEKHYGPGAHPGTGTSQDVHGSGNGARAQVIEIDVRPLADLQEIAYENLLNAIFPLWVSSPTDIARARGVTQMFIAADGRIFELPGEYMHQQAADAGLEGIQDEVAELANMDGDATALFTYGLHFIRSVAFNSDRNFTDGELMIDVRRKPTRAQIVTIEDILTAYRVEGIEPKLQWDWMSAGRYFPMESGTELQRLKDVTGVVRHYGPGPHSGTGTSQDVHGSGDIAPDQWMADFNKQLDALEDYFIDSHEEISSALNNEGWMDRSGTMYSLPRGDTHWSVAIDALHRSGVWSDWQAELARKMSSEATDPNIELINYGFIRFRGGGEYEDILAFEILEFDELTRGQREVIQVETQLAINAGWEVMVQPHAQRMGVPDMYETWEVQEKLGLTTRHYGPGAHPGTGTSQDVHGSGDGAAAVDTFIPDWTPTRYDDMPDRVKTFDIIEDAGAWGIYEGELHSTASKDHTWMARQITGDENATSDIFEVRGMVGRYRGAPIIVVYLTGDAGVNYGFPEMWLPDAQENMDLALKRWDDIVNEMAFGGEEPFLYVWDGTGVWIEKPSASKYFKMRHYGPGPHPGTGTSQDIHGGGAGPRSTSVRMTPTSRKQSGLGDFNIDRPAPSQNNSIVFDDEELRAKGYSEEVIKQQREWFFANVSAAIMKMEDELDIEIHGMEVTNSIMDLAERQAGPLVMGHPTRREAFLGRLREDTDEWLGGYYKGVVWLDDNHQGEILSGPEDYDFRETVNHEVGHFLTASDGRAKFGPDYVISMDDETYKPSKSYLDTMMKFYGDDESVVDDEYRADLIASYPIYAEEWIRIIPGTMNKHDKRNQAALVAALQEEAGYIIGPFTQRAEEDDDVLVFFPRAGEIRGVPRSALRNLPKDAVILSEVFKK